MLVFPDGSIEGTIGGGEIESLIIAEAQAALQDGLPRLRHYNFNDPSRGDPGVCGGEMDIYVEPILPGAKVVVFGIGHVGKAVVQLAHWLGLRVIAADDRPGFAHPDEVSEADETITCSLDALVEHVEIDARTFVVLTTRGAKVDTQGLPALMKTEAAYLGVIGSRRRWEMTAQELLEQGVDQEAISQIISPMGLELNAETPEEIALSIMAEIISLLRGGTGEAMAHQPHTLKANKGA
jgi:xanthine dehydrogenase accessory factor